MIILQVVFLLLMMILRVLLCPCYSHLATSDAKHPGELTHPPSAIKIGTNLDQTMIINLWTVLKKTEKYVIVSKVFHLDG